MQSYSSFHDESKRSRTADGRRLGGGDRERFRGNSSQKFDFARRWDAVARPGSRELRAVKIPASCDAWRPPQRQKNDSGKNKFFRVSEIQKSVFCNFSWILELTILGVKINFLVKFCSRYTYSEVRATKNCEKTICGARTWPPRALAARAQIYMSGAGCRPSPINIKL